MAGPRAVGRWHLPAEDLLIPRRLWLASRSAAKTGDHRATGASAPLKLLDVASNGSTNDAEHPFIVSTINLPTLGRWKITAHYAELWFE